MSAIISPCGLYRYRLDRRGENLNGDTVVIMVNPSTADAETDDATIRKLKGFGARRGWTNIVVGNLFAYRSKDVRELAAVADPVGPENDAHLRAMFDNGAFVRLIFAWGPMGKLPKRLRARWRAVYQMALDAGLEPTSIGAPAKDGHPCHPLMLPYDRKLQPWRPAL